MLQLENTAPLKKKKKLENTALRKILSTDNQRKRGIIIIDWCYLYKINEESVNHLLLHCLIAYEM